MAADSILVPSRLFLCYIAIASLNVIRVQREVIYLNSRSRQSGNLWHQTVKAQKSFWQLWNCVCTIWNCNLIWEDWNTDSNIDSAKKSAINLSIETNKQKVVQNSFTVQIDILWFFPPKTLAIRKIRALHTNFNFWSLFKSSALFKKWPACFDYYFLMDIEW